MWSVITRGSSACSIADEELMQQIRRGDDRAFEALYDRHAAAAFSLAYRMTGLRGAAEEVVQEAFLSLWRSHMGYDHSLGTVRTWLLRIVHNRSVDSLRRSSPHDRRRASAEGIEERFQAPQRTELDVLRRDGTQAVQSALRSLPPEQSRVIELAYFGGFTHTEIATMLDTPVGSIKGRMRLGLQKLRTQLSPTVE